MYIVQEGQRPINILITIDFQYCVTIHLDLQVTFRDRKSELSKVK